MLREDGFVMDDGTTARLSDDRWIMTTTTANAAKVCQHLEFCLQVLWPELDVRMASVSEQWAQIAVAGPRARGLLSRRSSTIAAAIANDAFPSWAPCETNVLGGVTARIFRLSFSGELGFEIAVPADKGEALARALMAAGADSDVDPYGLEALAVMRIEKGHVSGPELNGQTTASRSRLRPHAVDQEGLHRRRRWRGGRALIDPERQGFVGFRPVDRSCALRAGAHILAKGAAPLTENDLGYVTSATLSPILGHSIGLGFIKGGAARMGEIVRAWDGLRGDDIEVEICSPVFYDPKGERPHG